MLLAGFGLLLGSMIAVAPDADACDPLCVQTANAAAQTAASAGATGTPACIESTLVQTDKAAAGLAVNGEFTGTDDDVRYMILSGAPTCKFNCSQGHDINCDGKRGDYCPIELNLNRVKDVGTCLELLSAAAPATGGGDATAPLAHTGASTDSLLRASLALIAAGTTSLGIRRHHAKLR